MAISKITSNAILDGAIATADIADSAVTTTKLESNPQFQGTGSIKVPAGTTAERPASPAVGQLRYNTTVAVLEQYSADGWVGIEPAPTISSTTLPNSQTAVYDGDIVTVNGTGFKSGCTAKFVASGGSQYISPTVTRNSSTQLLVTITTGMPEGVYQLVVNNPSGLGATYDSAFTIDGLPVFTTASGSLGTADMGSSVTYNIAATEDGSAITSFAVTAGSLPSGVTLNSSTGVISGTLPVITADTTYSFTVTATDAENQKATRNFSINNTFVYYQTNAVRFGA